MIFEYLLSAIITTIYIQSNAFLGYLFVHRIFNKNNFLLNANIILRISIYSLLGLIITSHVWLMLGLYFSLNIISVSILLLIPYIIYVLSNHKNINKIFALHYILLSSIKEVILYHSFRKDSSKYIVFSNILLVSIFAITSITLLPIWDSEGFYMVWPKLISYLNNIVPLHEPFKDFSQIGISGELHFAVLMLLKGEHSAMFLLFYIFIYISIVLYSICRLSKLSILASHFCIFLLFTSSAFTGPINHGNVNLFSASYAIAGIYVLLYLLRNTNKVRSETKYFIISGIFLGGAIIAKLSYIVSLVPIISVILIYLCKDNYGKYLSAKLLKNLVYLITPIIVIITFLFIKNYALFSEPLAPFYLFNDENDSFLKQVWSSEETTRWILLTYPIAITFGQYPMQFGNISPIVLALLPFLFTFYKRNYITFYDKIPRILMYGSLLSIFLWILTNPSILAPRYILISYMIMLPFIAKLLDLEVLKKYVSKIIKALLLIGFLSILNSNVPVTLWMVYNEFTENREKSYRYYKSAEFINENSEYNSFVLIAGTYSYHLRPDILKNLNHFGDITILINRPINLEKYNYLYIQRMHYEEYVRNNLDFDENENMFKKVYEDRTSIIYRIIVNN